MQIEAEMVKRSASLEGSDGEMQSTFDSEIRIWNRLFSTKYVDRTLIGVLVMFFQRMGVTSCNERRTDYSFY